MERTDRGGRIAVLLVILSVILIAAAPGAAWAAEGAEAGGLHPVPPLWMIGFFVAMLLAIAVFPLTPLHHWWESNTKRLLVSVVLGAYPAWYYVQHDFGELSHVMLHEYVPFIVLLGSLFLIAGGIRLTGDLQATPRVNSAFIAIGTLLASCIGTTGASMLLIRPLLETNRERQFKVHTVIFFIFLVSNIGGSLLPIGDPPLFLGYLAGVPFFWTLNLWSVWLPTSLVVLGLYFLVDTYYYRRELPAVRAWDRAAVRPLRLEGGINFLWLLGVVVAVITMHAHSPLTLLRVPYAREGAMVLMVILAFVFSPFRIWKENRFTLGPIVEVAVLFLGIFVTMTPTLAILKAKGAELGVDTPAKFFWATGFLSSFLDNTPTYMVFFKAASGAVASGAIHAGVLIGHGIDKVPHRMLEAISAGAVFMGANTYIGNGPNFMVKAIAEESGIRMPSFFGYMKWSLGVLLPIFVLVTLVFFRGQ